MALSFRPRSLKNGKSLTSGTSFMIWKVDLWWIGYRMIDLIKVTKLMYPSLLTAIGWYDSAIYFLTSYVAFILNSYPWLFSSSFSRKSIFFFTFFMSASSMSLSLTLHFGGLLIVCLSRGMNLRDFCNLNSICFNWLYCISTGSRSSPSSDSVMIELISSLASLPSETASVIYDRLRCASIAAVSFGPRPYGNWPFPWPGLKVPALCFINWKLFACLKVFCCEWRFPLAMSFCIAWRFKWISLSLNSLVVICIYNGAFGWAASRILSRKPMAS